MERIGEGLQRLGKLDSKQIERVVSVQNHGDNRLFGEIAVDLDYVSVNDLLYYLRDLRQSEHEAR